VQTLRDIAPWLALSAAVLALIALVLAGVLWARLRSVRRAQVVVMGTHDQRDIVAHSEQLASQVRNLRQAVERLTDELDAHKRRLAKTLTHRALVRYDAFRDAGGQQSATLVLLDDYRSGFVISAIAARDFARLYVKILEQGVADRELSPEERRAVAEAVPDPLPPQPAFGVPAGAATVAEAPGVSVTPAQAAPAGETGAGGAAQGGTAQGGTPPAVGASSDGGSDAARSSAAGAPGPPGAAPAPPRRRSPLAVDDDFVWESREERGDTAEPAGGDEAGSGRDPA
jgi:outer membrane murein-binding lipoprotein Lpp